MTRPTRIATAEEFRQAWADARAKWGAAPSWLAHPSAVESWIEDARSGEADAVFPDGAVLVLDTVGNVRQLPRPLGAGVRRSSMAKRTRNAMNYREHEVEAFFARKEHVDALYRVVAKELGERRPTPGRLALVELYRLAKGRRP